MASENIIKIPLYHKSHLSCVGEREGCAYNAKVFYGGDLLASKGNLQEALLFAYTAVFLAHPTVIEHYSSDGRQHVLHHLSEAISLILGYNVHNNEKINQRLANGFTAWLDEAGKVKVERKFYSENGSGFRGHIVSNITVDMGSHIRTTSLRERAEFMDNELTLAKIEEISK